MPLLSSCSRPYAPSLDGSWERAPLSPLTQLEWARFEEATRTWAPLWREQWTASHYLPNAEVPECLNVSQRAHHHAVFVPSDPSRARLLPREGPQTSAAVLEALQGGELSFMGDSLSREHFLSTVRFLAAPALRHGNASVAALAQQHRVEHTPHVDRECVDIAAVLNGTLNAGRSMGSTSGTAPALVCYLSEHGQVTSTATLKHALGLGWLGNRSVLVANLGLHFGPRPVESYAAEVRAFASIADGLQAGASHGPTQDHGPATRDHGPTLFWRETSPQHFPTAHGLYDSSGGTGRSPQFQVISTKALPGSTWRHHNASLRNCVPLDHPPCDAAHDHFNSVASPILSNASRPVRVLPIWAATTLRWAEHFGAARFGRCNSCDDHTVRDCTHFCMPSATLDMWAALLVGHIIEARAHERPRRPPP